MLTTHSSTRSPTLRWPGCCRWGPDRRPLGNLRAPTVVDMSGEEIPTWEDVARQYGRFIYSVAYRLTGNADDAQDLVQEVLLRVRRGLATYRPGSMEGWLSRITTNVFLDDVR